MKTEYLITFELNSKLCTDVKKFKALLSSHEDITFKDNNLIFENISFPTIIAEGTLPDSSIYYDITIECNDKESNDIFSKLLREIRIICQNISGRNIIILHDGVGEEYCHQGYPIIFRTETLMRKLISKFMAISVGYDWKKSTTPEEVLKSMRIESKDNNVDYLQEVDFIQLSNFLFKKYNKNNINDFINSLKEISDDKTITIEDIKKYSPYTNWERYFAHIVNCESDFLTTRWKKLYDYRNKVAHCKGMTQDDFLDLKKISNEVIEKIESALNSINDIYIDEQDKEELAENLSSAANEKSAIFVAEYNKLSRLIQLICEVVSNDDDIYRKHKTNSTNIDMQSRYLYKNKNLITKEMSENIINARKFRNIVVHQVGISDIQESQLIEQIDNIDSIIDYLIMYGEDELKVYKGKDYSDSSV